MLRRFGFKKSEPRESEARIKLQKELFAYNKCVEHGFPHKPTALAYDPKLKIAAIGTKSGALRIYGKPGVEFSAHHPEEEAVTNIYFLHGQGRLITQCSNNTVYQWDINSTEAGQSELVQTRSFSMEASKLKTLSACCVSAAGHTLMMGTEGGNIHTLDTNSFRLREEIIYQDVVMQNVPDDFKVNPGAVEALAPCPTDPNLVLIGYNRGLIVLWDTKDAVAKATFNASQQLESLSWNRNGSEFMSAHADGSYIVWLTSDSTKPKEQATTPYGPFPCKAITSLSWKSAKADSYIMFLGGMPRASYGDRHTLSVMQGVQHTVFDFTSRVVDFVPLCNADEHDDIESFEYDDPHSILVLAEEELVAIDLQSEGWQEYRQPYLCSLHSSAITAVTHSSNVPESLWNKVVEAGELQFAALTSRDWPVLGGQLQQSTEAVRDMLLTGHEDGSVRFWDASGTTLRLLYKLTTADIFGTDVGADAPSPDEEEWPPFKKVGRFDPYSDDPRLAVQKLTLCALSETLVVGGTAGQVIIMEFSSEARDIEIDVKAANVNVISDRDNYTWKGHKALPVNEGDMKFAAGFQPQCVMQLAPPAAITALALHAEWQLVAAGTAHGYGVFDYCRRREVFTKCTLSPQDLSGTGESQMSRRKSFKKSLRESFRRLRNRRSQRAAHAHAKKVEKVEKSEKEKKEETRKESEEAKAETPASAATEGGEAAAAAAAAQAAEEGAAAAAAEEIKPAAETEPTTTVVITSEDPKPVERQVESRQAAPKDDVASMVRVLYFADTFLAHAQTHSPALFAGTNLGTIFCHEITMPEADKRESDEVTCTLRKELQLQHRAPVIYVCVIDKHAQPLPAPLEVTNGRAKAPDMAAGGHQLVVVSEEQFKIFVLPTLKASIKYKLTAHEGSKVRRVGLVSFRSKSDERYIENDLTILTNCGDVQVFSVPALRRQIKADCVRKENVNGIACSLFTQNGEGFYLGSPSEFVRFSVSARFATKPACAVEIAEGVRPPPPEPEPAEDAATEEEIAATPAMEEAAAAPAEGNEADNANDTAVADQSTNEPANDSTADTTIDSANMTVDSVRLHNVSETRSEQQTDGSIVTETSRVITSSTRIVKTTIIEQTGDAEPTKSETVVVTSESSDTGVVEGTAGDDSGAAVTAVEN
jgi:lethal(2) giant larvae protein